MRKQSKIVLLLALMLVLLVPAGIAVFAADNGTPADQTSATDLYFSSEGEVVIPQEVLDAIKTADPLNYDRNVENYKAMLVKLRVHPSLQQEIEKLVMEGYALPEILIAYGFLYNGFGTAADLRSFAEQQAQGASWNSIFTEYNRKQGTFTPRTFDSDYLEKLMNTPSLGTDDIMIADRISAITGQSFEDIIGEKQQSPHWQAITAKSGILFSADTLPRVQITSDQMQKFLNKGGLTEDQITNAAVTAYKIGQTIDFVIGKIQAGYSIEDIMAETYEMRYRS